MTEITYESSTWPSGDKLWTLARGIALAEGAFKQGSVPDRLNNPGDISDHAEHYGYEHHSGSNVTKFESKLVGWNMLRNKLYNISKGQSKVYTLDMTWQQFAQKWAADWRPWLYTVTQYIAVQPDQPISLYFT